MLWNAVVMVITTSKRCSIPYLCMTILRCLSAKNASQPYLFHQTGFELEGTPDNNLVIRVLNQLREDYKQIPPLEIWLHKRIPSGAGLGGGSSDAAFMMRLLNEQYDLQMDDEDIEYRLSQLGADCAFFYKAKPAYATGIGDQLMTLDFDLAGWNLVLVKPKITVSTRDAYAMVKPKPSEESLLLSLSRDPETWKDTVKKISRPVSSIVIPKSLPSSAHFMIWARLMRPCPAVGRACLASFAITNRGG